MKGFILGHHLFVFGKTTLSCNDAKDDILQPSNIHKTYKVHPYFFRKFSHLVPHEFYQVAVENSFWDQVDWRTLEGYNIPEADWKKVLGGFLTQKKTINNHTLYML